jgi:hypothetical protein
MGRGRPPQGRQGSRVHEGLVGARALVGTRYMGDAALRREYDEQIAPRTEAALGRIFGQIFAPAGPPPVVRRALDLGAGTGAAGRAVRARFGAEVEVVSVDRVPAPGVLGADLRRPGRPAGVTGRFDLITAAHLLNELGLDEAARAALVDGWCAELLEPGGTCVLVEPALRETSRGLLAVRDRLVAAGLSVVAPCFYAGPCPALARERDWCHDAAPWGDERLGQGRSRVDFSYLVLRRTPPAPAADPTLARVVSDPLREKGKLRVFVCGAAGRQALVRLDRDAGPSTADLDEAARGDVLRVEGGTPTGDGLRIGPEGRVRRA